MASYDSDEEQLEALKSWWKDNGNSLIIGIVIVLAALFGIRQWQSAGDARAAAASDLFQQISELAVSSLATDITVEDYEQAAEIYASLKTDFETSIYSRYGALLMARFHVENNAMDLAAQELRWVLDNPKIGFFKSADEELFLTARLRLARVLVAQQKAQEALDLLNAVEAGTMTGSYSEVKGDALLALGNQDAAREAYQVALALANNPALLQLKLDSLAVPEENLTP